MNPVGYVLILLKRIFIEQKEEPAECIFPTPMGCCCEKQ